MRELNASIMTTNVTTIKLEEGQESVTEIQTYLETFNKEIEGGQGEQLHVQCWYFTISFLQIFISSIFILTIYYSTTSGGIIWWRRRWHIFC